MFGISDDEPAGSTATVLFNEMWRIRWDDDDDDDDDDVFSFKEWPKTEYKRENMGHVGLTFKKYIF